MVEGKIFANLGWHRKTEDLAVLTQNYEQAAKFGLKCAMEYIIYDMVVAEDLGKYKAQIKREAELRLFSVEWP